VTPRRTSTSRRRPRPERLERARSKRLPDVIGPGTRVLFAGINPSLWSADVGHHFARPGNRFWKALRGAGCTDRLLAPEEDGRLPEYGYGLTNLAERPTARADELAPAELVEGAARLERKIREHAVRAVVFLGVTAYRAAFDRPKAKIGRQDHRIAGAAVWVLPNPSGLNAHYRLEDLIAAYEKMRLGVSRSIERAGRGDAKGGGGPRRGADGGGGPLRGAETILRT